VLYNVVGCIYFLFVVVVVVGMDLMSFWEDHFLVLIVFGEELFVDLFICGV
jgi:hypothetical protein